jgi:hypothetical protein
MKRALEKTLPDPRMKYKVVRRQAGLGSLGQQRSVEIGDWHCGLIAREVISHEHGEGTIALTLPISGTSLYDHNRIACGLPVTHPHSVSNLGRSFKTNSGLRVYS